MGDQKRRMTAEEDALALSARISALLAGCGPLIQGAALADLVSLYLAGHRPDEREEVLEVFVETVRKLTPASEVQILPHGLPESWKPQ